MRLEVPRLHRVPEVQEGLVDANGIGVTMQNEKGWSVIGNHVIPLNDLQEHTESVECACGPWMDGSAIVHNSYDGREFRERARDYAKSFPS